MSRKFFIIAGEPSGDRLGASLMSGLQQLEDVSFDGIGGPMMAAAGLQSRFPMAELSIMGLVEILPKIPKLLRRIRETAQAVVKAKPDALITIDSPDFTLRVAQKARELLPDLKVIHYVAPSVWAWRPERAEKMARHVDHVLALLPFEPPYMEAAGMSCDFVSHPVIAEPTPSPQEGRALRKELNIAAKADIITLLPGSRKSEITRMFPIYLDAARGISAKLPMTHFCVAVAPSVAKEVAAQAQAADIPLTLLMPHSESAETEARKRMLYRESALAIATSGTVALELAAQNCPMVIAYKANWATTRMVKKMAQIDTANLINILTNTRVVPEFLFENATAENIEKAALDILIGRDTAQKTALRQAMHALGKGKKEAHLWVARSVLRFLETR
ncbi:MAG: lipid-A-disaccharide synthase [Pseudomonadota bacterium]